MPYQRNFKRHEVKFMITPEQKARLLKVMEPRMAMDSYGRTVIRSLYFDTDDYLLIRRSIEKPVYKEKLRLRSYRRAEGETPVYVELKKKYDSIVYKRRLSMSNRDAMEWLCGGEHHAKGQIFDEIEFFLRRYGNLHPAALLSYEREAYFSKGDDDLRITFDDNILFRQQELTLDSEVWGAPVLDDDSIIMEVKCSGGVPLWLTEFLGAEKIYKRPFSKYGTAYRNMIFPELKKEGSNV